MRIGVSNLGWRREEDAELLAALEVDALEIAPTKLWDEPFAVPADTLAAYRAAAPPIAALHLTEGAPSEATRPGLRHFHASELGFGVLGTTGVDHERYAEALRRAGYEGVVSVEMLPVEGSNRERVLASVDHARRIYG